MKEGGGRKKKETEREIERGRRERRVEGERRREKKVTSQLSSKKIRKSNKAKHPLVMEEVRTIMNYVLFGEV